MAYEKKWLNIAICGTKSSKVSKMAAHYIRECLVIDVLSINHYVDYNTIPVKLVMFNQHELYYPKI